MAKRRGTLDDFEQLALGLELAQPVGESDLSPDGLVNLTDADMDRFLATTSGAGNGAGTDVKWGMTSRLDDEWLSEEASYKVGGRATTTRVTRSTPKMDTRTTGCTMPSVLVSPASSSSTAPMRGRRRASSSSSDASTSMAPSAATGRRGTKRRRGSSRQAGMDKESDEYRRRRVRNNVAVRKSRDKAKQRQEETTRKVTDLAGENESLTRQLDSVRQELSLLRSIFSNLGVPIQQLVTDALQSGSPGPSHSLSSSLQN